MTDPALPVAAPRGLSLGRRLVLTFVAIAIAIGSVVGVAIWAYVRQVDARHQVVDVIDPARVGAADLLSDYIDEETGVRGYVLTGDKSFLSPYEQAVAVAAVDRTQLIAVTNSDRVAARRLAAFDAATDRWREQFATPAIRATEARNPRYLTTAAELKGKALFDTSRAAYAALDSALSSERASSLATLRDAQDVFLVVLVVAGVVLVLVAAGAWRGLRRWVTTPLGRLGRDARRVADGELDHVVTPVGPPDVAALAIDVDAMRRRVLDEVALVEVARSELEASNADLARSNIELEQFAYVASHDLQEPLRKVVSFSQLLQRRYGGQLDERADEYIAFAVDGATRMQVLINDLLAFSRVGRSTAAFVPVDLDQLVRQATSDLSEAIDESGATVESGALPTVIGDPTLLAALLQNVLANALKFRGEASPVVTVAASRAGEDWLFSVADNGIGIEPRFADRVFVIFQRLHGRDIYAGTGIGLALCKKIVEFHGGRIWVDRGYHPGTRICWTLPVVGVQ